MVPYRKSPLLHYIKKLVTHFLPLTIEKYKIKNYIGNIFFIRTLTILYMMFRTYNHTLEKIYVHTLLLKVVWGGFVNEQYSLLGVLSEPTAAQETVCVN